jgi:hypothetical protein
LGLGFASLPVPFRPPTEIRIMGAKRGGCILETQACSNCGQEKKFPEEFHRWGIRWHGSNVWCNDCQRVHRSARLRSSLKYRAEVRISNIRYRAKQMQVEFTLTPDWYQQRLEAGTCEITGLAFNMGFSKGDSPDSPSIFRIDKTKGFTPENCLLVLNRVRRSSFRSVEAQSSSRELATDGVSPV